MFKTSTWSETKRDGYVPYKQDDGDWLDAVGASFDESVAIHASNTKWRLKNEQLEFLEQRLSPRSWGILNKELEAMTMADAVLMGDEEYDRELFAAVDRAREMDDTLPSGVQFLEGMNARARDLQRRSVEAREDLSIAGDFTAQLAGGLGAVFYDPFQAGILGAEIAATAAFVPLRAMGWMGSALYAGAVAGTTEAAIAHQNERFLRRAGIEVDVLETAAVSFGVGAVLGGGVRAIQQRFFDEKPAKEADEAIASPADAQYGDEVVPLDNEKMTKAVAQGEEAAPPPAATNIIHKYEQRKASAGDEPIVEMNPQDISVNAAKFQFRSETTGEGVTDALANIDRWNSDSAGIIMAWEQADGKIFVINGHQRLALWKRLKAQGKEPPETIAVKVLKEKNGVDADEAFIRATIINIQQEQRMTPRLLMDATKALRKAPEILNELIGSTRPKSLADIVAISKVNDATYGEFWQQRISHMEAIAIGNAELDDVGQAGMVVYFRQAQREGLSPATVDEAESIIRMVMDDGVKKKDTDEQALLEGWADLKVDLGAIHKAKILTLAKRRIKEDARLWRTITKSINLDKMKAAGHDVGDADVARGDASSRALDLVMALADKKGTPFNEALNRALDAFKKGASYGKATDDFINDVAGTADEYLQKGAGGRKADNDADSAETGGQSITGAAKQEAEAEQNAIIKFTNCMKGGADAD